MIRWLTLFFLLAPQLLSAQTDPGAWLNAFRADMGRAELIRSSVLDDAAAAHAADLAGQDRLSHQGRDGSQVMDRVRSQGFNACFVAENIAMGQASDTETFTDWANSPGHRRNMAHRRATQFGFANAGPFRVLVLAAPC
jgi:uncharacterized protein YkwD